MVCESKQTTKTRCWYFPVLSRIRPTTTCEGPSESGIDSNREIVSLASGGFSFRYWPNAVRVSPTSKLDGVRFEMKTEKGRRAQSSKQDLSAHSLMQAASPLHCAQLASSPALVLVADRHFASQTP